MLNVFDAVIIKDTKQKLSKEISKKSQLNDTINALETAMLKLEDNLKCVKEEYTSSAAKVRQTFSYEILIES